MVWRLLALLAVSSPGRQGRLVLPESELAGLAQERVQREGQLLHTTTREAECGVVEEVV